MTSLSVPADLLRSLRMRAGVEGSWAALRDSMFAEQRLFVEDGSPKKAALCSRRAGKTHGTSCWLYEGADLAPNGLSAYIGLSKSQARRTSWTSFQKLNRVFQLGLKFSERDGQLYVTHRNGHTIWLAGCADASEVDKFRGATDGFHRVVVDEAQAFGSFLQELVEDALEPALLDNQGSLALTGTPGPVCAGYFHAVTTGDGLECWPTHHWTVLQNRSIPHAAAWLERRRLEHKWSLLHPTYRREWLGEWVNDAGALVYPFERSRNTMTAREDGSWRYVLGVDLGFRDATAFVLLGTIRGSGVIHVLSAEKHANMLPQAIEARISQYRAKWRLGAVVVDEGGLGKGYAEQMRANGTACKPAVKTTKRAAQEWVRGLILSGQVLVDYTNARSLTDECSVLSWDEDGEAEDERFENHCADAFLYGCREIGADYRPEKEPPKDGTPEHAEAQRLAWREQEIRRAQERRKREKPSALVRRLAAR